MIARLHNLFPRHRAMLAAAGLLVTALVAHAQQYSASATFSPAQIGAGQTGNYQINVSVNSASGGLSQPSCTPPQVDGLDMSPNPSVTNFRQSTQFVNGVVSGSLSFTIGFQVRAQKNGKYTVPSFTMTMNGHEITVPEATLEVTDQPAGPSNSDLVSLTTNIKPQDLYVGQMVPFDLSLYWRADLTIQVTGDLAQGDDAFERVDLKGRGDQESVSKNGQSYFANIWHSDLIPLVSGPQAITFSLPMDVTIPDASGVADPLVAQFMGPNSPFVMGGQQRSMNAATPTIKLNVLPLPTDGRPEHFTGGVGTFSADEPTLSSDDLQVGVPVTLTLKVSGQGNFDRFNTPVIDLGTLWRAYPTKDSFKAEDEDGYHGEKTFQYTIMPLSDKITFLHAPEVNFFNPESKSYIALPLQDIPVKVRPAEPGQAAPPLPTLATTAPATQDNSGLVPLHTETGAWQDVQPVMLLQSPVFWLGQAAPAILLAGFVLTRRRQLRIENDPVYARRLRARKQAALAVAQAKAAAAKGDAPGFYAIAQRALQEAATHDRLDAAEALTWREFDAHLATRGVDVDVRQRCREIFESGDALRFGGYTPDKDALAEAAARLDGLVQQLLGRA